MPTKEKNKPTAPSENAAGYPINKNTIKPPNMMGAIKSWLIIGEVFRI
jgi:hypothetical protein